MGSAGGALTLKDLETKPFENFSDFLSHYGVKGMKWGVRRSKDEINNARSEDSKSAGRIQAKAKATKIGSLSNKELQEAITRMNLERQYNSLAPKTGTQKAKEFVAQTLLGVGKQQAVRIANDEATRQVNDFLKNRK